MPTRHQAPAREGAAAASGPAGGLERNPPVTHDAEGMREYHPRQQQPACVDRLRHGPRAVNGETGEKLTKRGIANRRGRKAKMRATRGRRYRSSSQPASKQNVNSSVVSSSSSSSSVSSPHGGGGARGSALNTHIHTSL